MRTLSFITRYSAIYRGPLVEIYVNDKAVVAAIPYYSKNRPVGDAVSFRDSLVTELVKDEYKFLDHEVQAIIEFLMLDGFFDEFEYSKQKKNL